MGGTLSKPDPSRTVEVIGAGYSRTGTSSMQLALETLLQGPVHHGGTHIWMGGNDAHVKLWAQACDAKFKAHNRELTLKLVREAVKGYAGVIDMPSTLFIPELVELFPDAKVVLNTRDPEKWYASISNLLGHLPSYLVFLSALCPGIRWIPKIIDGWLVSVDDLLRNDGRELGKHGPFLLELHNQQVIDVTPKDQLLVTDVKSGWAPLAGFLGKPIPDEPFPRVNETEALDNHAKTLFMRMVWTWVKTTLFIGGGAYCAWNLVSGRWSVSSWNLKSWSQ